MMKSNYRTSEIETPTVPRRGKGVIVIVLVLLLLPVRLLANGATGYGRTSIASPVRSATVPPSSYQEGLVRRPNPIDGSSNLVVTGNVGAGKHFRGHIPYRSTTSIQAPLGSTSLDSFMRYTAASETPTTSAGAYSPFYSSSGTAAAMQPGTRSVFLPNTSRMVTGVAPRPVDTTRETLYSNTSLRLLSPGQTEAAAGKDGLETISRLQLWPLSQGPEAATPSQAETLTNDDYRRQMEALQQRLGEVKTEAAQLEQSLTVQNDPSASAVINPNWGLGNESESAIPEGSHRQQLLQETARLLAGTTGLPAAPVGQEKAMLLDSETDPASETPTDTERRLQLYDPIRVLSQTGRVGSQPTVETRRSGRVGLAPPKSPYGFEGIGGASPTLRTLAAPASDAQFPNQSSDLDGSPARIAPETAVVQPSVQSPIRKVDVELAATSVKEFTRHLQLAERYFRRGDYRHAADAYALATAYRPTDPRAHLGRSHALLATGQYDASAVSLAKAMELDPQFVLKKVDLIDIVGGPDAFIARFNDLDETVQAGEAPMLQFLLAYIYHQMERPMEGRAAIAAAQRILPSSISIDLLKTAICR